MDQISRRNAMGSLAAGMAGVVAGTGTAAPAQASEGASATGAPLIALDMYEHAFHMDYGAAAAKYVDAFMRNLDWEIVEKRFSAAVARI